MLQERTPARYAWALIAAVLGGRGGADESAGAGGTPQPPGLSAMAAAGRALFADKRLSVSGQQSCGTCHVPSRAFTGGAAPTLDAREIDQPVAFLCTLTDGYDPTNPAAYTVPAQCQPGAD